MNCALGRPVAGSTVPVASHRREYAFPRVESRRSVPETEKLPVCGPEQMLRADVATDSFGRQAEVRVLPRT